MTVLAARGVQSEARLAFAGCISCCDRSARGDDLTAAHRAALDAAFGIGDDRPPEHFRIAMAVLDLLSEVATEAPALLVVEDAHWLDRPSADVLAFVARRLESDPIVLLASREGYPSPFADAGCPSSARGARPCDGDALLDGPARICPPRRAAGSPRGCRQSAGARRAAVDRPVGADQPLPRFAPAHRSPGAGVRRARCRPSPRDAVAAPRRGGQDSESSARSCVPDSSPEPSWSRRPSGRGRRGDRRPRRADGALPPSADALSGAPERERGTAPARPPGAGRDAGGRARPAVWHRAALITGEHEDVAADLEEARGARAGAGPSTSLSPRCGAPASSAILRSEDGACSSAGALAVELGQAELARAAVARGRAAERPVERALVTWIEDMINPPELGDARASRGSSTRPSAPGMPASATCTSGCCGWRSPGRGGRIPERTLAASSSMPLAGWAAPRIRTCACSPSTRAPIRSATRRGPTSAAGRDGHGEAIRSPYGSWGQPHSSSVPSISLLAARVRRRRGTHGGTPGTTAPDARSARHRRRVSRGLGRRRPRGRGGAATGDGARRTTLIAGGETVLSVVAGMRGDADAAERGAARAEHLASPPAARSLSHLPSSGVCSARWERAGTTTHTHPPGGCSTPRIRRTTRSWPAGSSPTWRRPPSTPTASTKAGTRSRGWRK